jgi:hypothetical protein
MKTKQFLTIMPSIIRATDKVIFAMKSQVAPIIAGTMLAVTGTAFAASALTPAATTPNSQRPKIATVTQLTNGDYSCYVNLVDGKGKKYEGMYGSFDFCANEKAFLNKKVRLSYGQARIYSDTCQGRIPCNQTRVVTLITKMQVIASVSDEELAALVIRHYFNAINRRDYKSAYADWSDNGAASQQSFEQFQQGFKDTKSVQLNIGQLGFIHGSAGHISIKIPVNIIATSVDGTTKRFRGSYVLQRVNDVPGSTLSERMWHIFSANIIQVN